MLAVVSHAFNVLNDPNKRRHYDQFGEDTRIPSDAGPQFRQAQGFGRQGATMFEDEISPEDLFNMFFGGNMGTNFGPQVRVHQFGNGNPFFNVRHNGQQQQQQRNRTAGENTGSISTCIQFLPLIMLFAMFLISNFFSAFTGVDDTPAYSFSQQGPYTSNRITQHYRVPYWVNDNEFTRSHISRRPSRVRQFEQDIEAHYISNLQRKCQQEMSRRRLQIHNAKGWFGLVKDPKKLERS